MAAFKAVGGQSAGTGSVNVAWPTHAIDDLGIMVIETGGEGSTLSVPSGWTAVTGSPVTDVATNAGSKLQVWYRFATSAAESNVATGDSGDHQVARIFTFDNVDKTTPFDATGTSTKTTASTTVTWNAITTTVANTLVVLIATRPNDATSVTSFGSYTAGGLDNITEAGEAGSNAGHGGGYTVAYGDKASAGSTGTPGATITVSVTNAEMVFALRPRISTGSLSATETGDDTFSANGTVANAAISGSMSATETGADTFSASGTVADPSITGSMAATETGSDTFAGAGNVLVSGSLAATETGSDTFAGSGNVLVSGSLAVTETGTDAFSGQGFLTQQGVTGSLAATETGDDTAAASGKVLVSGSLDAFEVGQDVCLADGTVLVSGALMAQESGNDTFAGQGNTGGQSVAGSMSATESGLDTLGGYVNEGYVLDGYVDTGIAGTVKTSGSTISRRKIKKTAFIQSGLAPTLISVDGKAIVSGVFAVSSCAQVTASGTIIVNGVAAVSSAVLSFELAEIQARSYGNTSEEELLLLLIE